MTPPTAPADRSQPSPVALGAFVVAVLALSWLQFAFVAAETSGSALPAAVEAAILLAGGFLSPLWAVLAVGGAVLGWRGLSRLLRASVQRGPGPRVYALAAVGPIAAVAVAAALVPGAGWHGEIALGTLVAVVGGSLVANLIESVAWRAWLQEGLQRLMSPLLATVLVGVVWGLWHLPLLYLPESAQAQLSLLTYLPLLVALSVLLGALYNASSGSVWPVTVAHTAFNVSMAVLLVTAPVSAAEANRLVLVLTGLFAVAGALAAWRLDMLRAPARTAVPSAQ